MVIGLEICVVLILNSISNNAIHYFLERNYAKIGSITIFFLKIAYLFLLLSAFKILKTQHIKPNYMLRLLTVFFCSCNKYDTVHTRKHNQFGTAL